MVKHWQIDRRGQGRFEIVGHLWGSLETVGQLPLRNLGSGGALLEARMPLPPDSVHSGRLTLHGYVCEFELRVRHVTAKTNETGALRYLIGVEFLGLQPGAREQIDRLVSGGRGAGTPRGV